MSPRTIIVTGASRGIGLAIAQKLLREKHNVVLVARTAEPMEELKKQYPEQVEVVVGDLSDFKIGPQAVDTTIKRFSKLDGLIVNHGILSPVKRIADSTPEEWRTLFDVNFFSALAFVTPAIPHLRTTQGTILLTSSGAAVSAYSTWGPYGSSKAALNHLAQTLSAEEPLITTLAIRPGVVDTDMQKEARFHSTSGVMDKKDADKFIQLHEGRKLLKPEQPGGVMAGLAVDEKLREEGLRGKFLSWDDKLLEKYRD
ncbi:2b2c8394-0d37-4d64-a10a-02fcf722d5ce [Sclerotinia trifoliorum]|uniref:2b2c8394-0d37-4d64-a10a-02fcf722d5ce n=1 Tax=Sclerotinia trifoliorum TaxID=28548 RepID=A0A8H2VS97_9HELO|nr:2b2c8394-0d37-4d64-a10a-02fcf722d5ce [Sclerotinia trifoliorum]